MFPDAFRLCHLRLRCRRKGEGSFSSLAVPSYVLPLGALGLGGCISWVEKPKRQTDDCKLLMGLLLLLVLMNTQTLPPFKVKGFVKKMKVRICDYQMKRFKSLPLFLMGRLASIWEVPNEAVVMENNESEQQLFPKKDPVITNKWPGNSEKVLLWYFEPHWL